MIILRNKEFSDSNKEKEIDKKALAAGLASMGVGGYNFGKVRGTYGAVRDSSKDMLKKSKEYKNIKAANEKMAKEFKEVAERAKNTREQASKVSDKLRDKITRNIGLRKIERLANKAAKSATKAADKSVNRIARNEGLRYIAKHNKKNIAVALAGTAAGTALINKSTKNKKKEDDSTKK